MVYDINGNEICSNNLTKLVGVASATVIKPTSGMQPVSGASMIYPVNPCQKILIKGAANFVWLKQGNLALGNESGYFGGWCECDENGAELFAAPDCHYLMVEGDASVYSCEEYKDFTLKSHDLTSTAAYMSNLSIRFLYHFFVRNMYGGNFTGALTGVAVDAETSHRVPAVFTYNIADVICSGFVDYGLIGTTKYALINQCIRYMQALVSTHSNWTGYWQSSLTAAYLASAAYRLKDYLPSELYVSIQSIIVAESDILVTKEIGSTWKNQGWQPYFNLYWKDTQGNENPNCAGDSKSEEAAWYSTCLGMAIIMCPTAPNLALYKNKFIEWNVISFSTPSDKEKSDVVNGYSLSDLDGSNMTDDGIVINHNMIHPDYMSRAAHFIALRAFMWAGIPIPRANLYNMEKILDGYVNFKFTSQKYLGKYQPLPPYGEIIKDDAYDVYFPQGNDWGSARYACEAEFLIYAHACGISTRYDCTRKAAIFLEKYLALQDRFTDGRIVNSTSENSYSNNMYITNCGSAMIPPLAILWFLARGLRVTDDTWYVEE